MKTTSEQVANKKNLNIDLKYKLSGHKIQSKIKLLKI